MRTVGNEAFNRQYEARLPDFPHIVKPTLASSKAYRSQYIATKYLLLLFASAYTASLRSCMPVNLNSMCFFST